jgi:hypothetical protein
VGIEGPLGTWGYLRGAVLYTRSAHDEIEGGTGSAIGDRLLAHASLNLPVGRGALSLYAWEMRRFSARGAGILVPQGNLLAFGVRCDWPLSPTVTVAPILEARHEMSGADELEVLGWIARPGMEVRWRLGTRATLVAGARYAVGQLSDEGTTVSVGGPRLLFGVEWAR